MATSLQWQIPGAYAQTYRAAAVIGAGYAVKLSAAGIVTVCTANTDPCIGITQNDSDSELDESGVTYGGVAVVMSGPAFARMGGAVPASGGGIVMPASDGRLEAWTATGSKRQVGRVTDYLASNTTAAGDMKIVQVGPCTIVD